MQKNYNNINPTKLHNELIKAGITPLLVENDCPKGAYIAPNTYITFADGTDMNLVDQVIAAHNPAPLPVPPTAEERLAALEAAMLEVVLGG